MTLADTFSQASTMPFWLDSPLKPDLTPHLSANQTADLAIVGGGFSGLWTALLAKERDPNRSVVLLEGNHVGWAASGRNGGFCSASLTHGYDNGTLHLPEENDRLYQLGLDNLDEIESAVARYGMNCEFERTGELNVATEPYQVKELQAAHDPTTGNLWLDTEELRDHIRSPRFLGALFDTRGNAMVNPARLCWELLRVIQELGVQVYENTIVRSLESNGNTVTLHCDKGTVTAPRVALGTNVFPALINRARWYTVPVYDYALMTEPLTGTQLEAIGWRNRQGLADSANQFHYFRITADNRILWGGWDVIYHYGKRVSWRYDQREATFHTLATHFFDTFPQLRGVKFTHKWGGAIDTCSRFFPFFMTAHGKKVAYTAGLTGLGVGASRFGARVMLDLLSGEETELTELNMVRKLPVPFPPEPLASLGIYLTKRAIARSDLNEGKRGPLLKVLDNFKIGFNS